MPFLYLESQRMPIKHRVGTPTGFLGCHSSWNRGTDPPRPPAQPTGVPSCCFWPHRGKARDVPGLLALPAYWNPALSRAHLNPMPRWTVWTRHPLSPPRPRSGGQTGLDRGQAPATPGGAQGFLLGITCLPFHVSRAAFRKGKESAVAQSCLILCDPTDCSLPASSVYGIFQARVLEWAAISFSRGSSWPKDQTRVSLIAGRHFTIWATREATFINMPWLTQTY